MRAKPWAVCTVMVLCGLAGEASGQQAETGSLEGVHHLLRLRAGPVSTGESATQHRIPILADHTHWPQSEAECTCLALTAVTARIALPAGYELSAIEIPESLGPIEHWYPVLKADEDGWFLGLFPLHASVASLPEATSRHLWTLVVEGSSESGAPELTFLAAPEGSDEGTRIYFSNGTSAVPRTTTAVSDGFPIPSEADLQAVVEQPVAPEPAEGSGGGENLLGGGDPETPCDELTYALGDVPTESEVDVYYTVPGQYQSIQAGVNAALTQLNSLQSVNAVAVVAVAPGVYNESVVISAQGWLGHLVVVSTIGPGPDSDVLPANVDRASRIDPLGQGPCILIYGSLGTIPPSTGRVTIGWSITEDDGIDSPFPGVDAAANVRGWRGFDLVNGGASGTPPFSVSDALGIVVRDVESPVEIRGCWIHDHLDSTSAIGYDGAGVGIIASENVSLLQCDISDKTAWNSGAGVYCTASSVRIGRCFIHDNSFHGYQPVQMMGGGVHSRLSRLALCSSYVYGNSARLGAGVAFALGGVPDLVLWAEDNAFYENTGAVTTSNPLSVPYRGAGLWVGPDPVFPPIPSPVQHSIGLLRCRFRGNDVTIPPMSPVGNPPPANNAVGGGAYFDANLAASGGPLILYPSGFGRNLLIGNAFWRNTAQDLAGGAYLGLWTSPDSLAFESNTFYNNALENSISGLAADLFIPFSGAPAQLGYVALTGGNQLLENTSSIFQSSSWFAQCDPTGLAPNPPLFPQSHLDDLFPAGCVSANTSANLRIASSSCTDSNAGVFLRNLDAPDELPALGPASPCIDQGSDWSTGGDSNLYSVFLFDLELDPRPNNEWDPGAEELLLYDFIRGDTTGDGTVNIADPVRLLEDLFPTQNPPLPPLTCRDRGDANDDGTVNIADSIAILGYLFGGQDPLPPPFLCPPGAGTTFCCGQDPTADTIDPCDAPYGGTCP